MPYHTEVIKSLCDLMLFWMPFCKHLIQAATFFVCLVLLLFFPSSPYWCNCAMK